MLPAIREMIRLLHRPLFIVGVLFLTAVASAKDTLNLTLPQAVRMALENNLDIKVESYFPLIDAERIRIEGGAFDPVLNARFTHLEDAYKGGGVTQTEEFGGGVRGDTPWGLNYSVGAENSYDWVSKKGGMWSLKPNVSLQQPLLRGFGTDVNLAQLRIARRNQQQSEWALRGQVVNTVADVHAAYDRLYQSLQNLEVAKRFKELAEVLLRDNETRMKIGVMAPLDVTQARAQVAQRQETLIVAAAAVEDNKIRLKQLILSDVEGFVETGVEIAPPPTAVVGRLDVNRGIQDAFEWRADYRQFLLDLQKRRIQVVFQKNGTLPRLDLVGSLSLLGIDRTFSEGLSRSVADGNQQSWSAGAIFSLPIPNRSASGKYQVAKLEEIQTLASFKRLELAIAAEVDFAAREITTSAERIKATTEARLLAQETLDAAQERLKAGSGTTFEVLELQRKLAEAEAAEVSARADHNRAISEYDRVTGTILQRNGIEMNAETVKAAAWPKEKSKPKK